jgi:hypothetical protein
VYSKSISQYPVYLKTPLNILMTQKMWYNPLLEDNCIMDKSRVERASPIFDWEQCWTRKYDFLVQTGPSNVFNPRKSCQNQAWLPCGNRKPETFPDIFPV